MFNRKRDKNSTFFSHCINIEDFNGKYGYGVLFFEYKKVETRNAASLQL